jgi:hypothetical protein
MQWLTLVPENSGVQRLQADMRRTVAVRSVDAIAPCPPPHPVDTGDDRQTRSLPAGAPQGERRSGEDRRRRQVPVVLDTRSSGDRRESAIGADGQPKARRRINLYA